jgi:hypothetical protein
MAQPHHQAVRAVGGGRRREVRRSRVADWLRLGCRKREAWQAEQQEGGSQEAHGADSAEFVEGQRMSQIRAQSIAFSPRIQGWRAQQ